MSSSFEGFFDRHFYLFLRLALYLDLESVVCLYHALPPRRRTRWFHPDHFSRWLKAHVNRDLNPGRCLALERVTTFAEYVQFVHFCQHSDFNQDGHQRLDQAWYEQTSFVVYPTLPAIRNTHVVACLFLPMTAPSVFAGNLVVACRQGQVYFFTQTLGGLRLTASLLLRSTPHGLACSPLGSTLLLAHHHTTLLRLRPGGRSIEMFIVRVHIAPKLFRRDCFVDEDSFIAADADERVWMHTLVIETSNQGLRLSRPTLQTRLLHAYNRSSDAASLLVALFKRPGTDDGSPACLIAAKRRVSRGLGCWLRFDFGPLAPGRPCRWLVRFPSCIVASVVLHPDHDRALVLVVTKLTRTGFWSVDQAPTIYNHQHKASQIDEESLSTPPFDHKVTGWVGVYQIRFRGSTVASATPRFYLTGMTTNFKRGGESNRHSLYSSPDVMELQAQCNRTHLTVRLNHEFLAHLPLAQSYFSHTHYQLVYSTFDVWDFSERHSYGATFDSTLQGQSFPSRYLRGWRCCTHLAFMQEDTAPSILGFPYSRANVLVPVSRPELVL